MRWRPSTSGEDLYLRLQEGLGDTIEITGSGPAALEFLTSEEYFVEFVRVLASMEVFMRCIRVAREFVRDCDHLPPLELGKALMHAVDLPRAMWTDRAFCETAKLAGRIAQFQKRDKRLERAAVRGDDKHCYMCGIALTKTKDALDQLSVEHLWPLAFGGESTPENLVAACADCNNKRDRMLTWAAGPVQSTYHFGRDTPDSMARLSLGLARLIKTAGADGRRLLTLKQAAILARPLYVRHALKADKHYLYVDLFQLSEGAA